MFYVDRDLVSLDYQHVWHLVSIQYKSDKWKSKWMNQVAGSGPKLRSLIYDPGSFHQSSLNSVVSNYWVFGKTLTISCFRELYTLPRRRQWHPTPVLLPGKSHGWRSLVGCSPWGLRVRHNWATSLSLFTFLHWRRKWQPTPVFLPGGSQGGGSLVGCRLWGHTESDTTEAT